MMQGLVRMNKQRRAFASVHTPPVLTCPAARPSLSCQIFVEVWEINRVEGKSDSLINIADSRPVAISGSVALLAGSAAGT